MVSPALSSQCGHELSLFSSSEPHTQHVRGHSDHRADGAGAERGFNRIRVLRQTPEMSSIYFWAGWGTSGKNIESHSDRKEDYRGPFILKKHSQSSLEQLQNWGTSVQ